MKNDQIMQRMKSKNISKYVYVYLDPRKPGKWVYKNLIFDYKPFYVGVGQNKRILAHLFKYSLKRKSIKNSILKAILSENLSPMCYKIYENLTSIEAFVIEADFIKHFGRQDLNSGILANHTDGGIGSRNYKTLKVKKAKVYYAYFLNGLFDKEYTYAEIKDVFNAKACNISTSIKRNGTCFNRIWKYSKEESVEPAIKYQMPRKFKNIKQIDRYTGEVLNTYKDTKDVIAKLNVLKGRSGLTNCLTGRSKTFLNYKWEAETV